MEFVDKKENSSKVKALRDALNLLAAQREALEAEAEAIHCELTSPGPNNEPPAGIKDSMIDSEGFPRGDIDVINVKNKRRRLAEINTDYKVLMKRIEGAMVELHQALPSAPAAPVNSSSSGLLNLQSSDSIITVNSQAMAKLDEILQDSPAALAGIQDGDLLLQFDNITASTDSFMTLIAQLVGKKVNESIRVVVKRPSSGALVELELVPKPWGGRGLLGCHLTPIKT
mmetsp:Transcript_37122/g.73905  ORF Transcript_37122/g.73905 Transcript_37122/m.73905 type:complete len:228 (-) Transcript_37122:88-771(-)|eukprot:CAMPEP_0170390008 /NCGR_PEP_ID=MMETSP0117_2-20130122/18915_1 /TAXON_ID=400756 /ORGANISM="Durinskia baltica, Strain CSIRO CS-38" /LENGTH=227 /DNA_ID=CAMNT_0010646021 /DNA_START=59 /DNA_END=742 /DNA_ORIENTATION=+